MQERRYTDRLMCAELVELKYREMSGFERRRVVNLEDISLSGACIQLEKRIADGTPVTINYGGGTLVGKVRYCGFRDTSYFLGIQFEDGCEWSESSYRPEHLLNPQEMVEGVLERL